MTLQTRGSIAVGSLILAITAVFILTYPLNIAQYDAVNYLRMILANQSNLIHASGYAFLLRHFLSLFSHFPPDQALFVETPTSAMPAFLFKLLIANHAIHLIIVASVTWILAQTFGTFISLVTAILWACSLFFLGAVSISQPEFLQGDLLLLTVALCSSAFMRTNIRAKLLLYALASFCFAWVFLVKYNALAFAGFFLLILGFDSAAIKTKIAGLAACIAIFACTLGGYIWLFHQPSTGSWNLNHDRAWVYVIKLHNLFGPDVLQRSPGIAALRWEALTVTVPQEYGGFPYGSLKEGASPEQKQKYRPKVDAVLAMTESELRQYIHDNPHQPGFEFSRTAHPLYWYIGLAEADDLGSAMFWEYIRNNLGFVVKTVLTSTVQTTLASVANPYTPTAKNPLNLLLKADLANGFLQMGTTEPTPIFGMYWSYNLILWDPGMRLFGMFERLRLTPWTERFLFLCLAAGLLLPFVPREQKRIVGALGIGVIGFIAGAHFVFVFRAKEAAALWPVACLLWAIAVKWGTLVAMTVWPQPAKVRVLQPISETFSPRSGRNEW